MVTRGTFPCFIRDFEKGRRVPSVNDPVAMRAAIQVAGVEFIAENGGVLFDPKTGEVVWRKGATHIGQNVGKTDFWAITVEPA